MPRLLRNTDPVLRAGWWPLARTEDLVDELAVDLLGESWLMGPGPTVLRGPYEPHGIVEHAGMIWLAPLPPVADLIPLPEAEDDSYASAWLPAFDTSAPAGLYLDNQLDVAHFPFVHTTTFGDPDAVLVPEYDLVEAPNGFSATVDSGFLNVADPLVATGERTVEQVRRLTYRFALPMQLHLDIEHVQTGQRTVLLFATLPQAEGRTRLWLRVLRNDVPGHPGSAVASLPDTIAFETRVVLEDLALQEQFDVPGLPLEQRLEVAVKADRTNLVLRRMLRTLYDEVAA